MILRAGSSRQRLGIGAATGMILTPRRDRRQYRDLPYPIEPSVKAADDSILSAESWPGLRAADVSSGSEGQRPHPISVPRTIFESAVTADLPRGATQSLPGPI